MLAQIQEIDGQLSHAIEAYNLANVKLDRIQAELKTNSRHLTIARTSLKAAQVHLSERLVALYKNGGDGAAIEVLLGARSIDDLLNRLDAVDRVSEQDARVLREVKSFRAQVIERKGRLERAQSAQVQVVADKAAQRSSIEGQLAERQRLLSSIKDQIASLEAAERRRQERLAAQAQARFLAAQQAAVPGGGAGGARRVGLARGGDRARAGRPLRRRRRDRDAVPRRPVRLGRRQPVGLRLLRLLDVRLRADRRLAAAPRRLPVRDGHAGLEGSAPGRRPGLLQRPRPLGIYIGGGQFIHSPHTGDVVKISSLSDSWYARTWVGARRL